MGLRGYAHPESKFIILDHAPGTWDLEFLPKGP